MSINKKVNPIKKKSLKHEFENNPISLTELLEKHQLEEWQLGDISNWKPYSITEPDDIIEEPQTEQEQETIIAEIVESPPHQTQTQTQTKTTVTNIAPKPPAQQEEDNSLLSEIHEVKKSILKKAKETIDDDYGVDTKELKDLTSIVKSLEDGELNKQGKGPQQGNTVVVAIQNLVEKFRDDC